MGIQTDILKLLSYRTGIGFLLVFHDLCDWVRSSKVKRENNSEKWAPGVFSHFETGRWKEEAKEKDLPVKEEENGGSSALRGIKEKASQEVIDHLCQVLW